MDDALEDMLKNTSTPSFYVHGDDDIRVLASSGCTYASAGNSHAVLQRSCPGHGG